MWDDDRSLEEAPEGYDSVTGMPVDDMHPYGSISEKEYVVYNPEAAVVSQVIVFTHDKIMCPNCGIRCDFPDYTGTVTGTFVVLGFCGTV